MDDGQRHAPAALPPRKMWYPFYKRLDGPQGRSGRVRKISPPLGFDPRTVQLVPSRYTVYVIPMCTVSLSLNIPMAKSESLYTLAYTTFGSDLWHNIAENLRVRKIKITDWYTARGLSKRSRLYSWQIKLNASTHNEVSLPRSQKQATPYYSEQGPSNTYTKHTNFHFKFLNRYNWYRQPTGCNNNGLLINGCIIPQAVTHSSAPEDGRNHRPKHVELNGFINNPLLLHLVGCLYYLY